MKKFISFSLVVTMLVALLAGCAKPTVDETKAPATNAPQESQTSDSGETESPEPTGVTYPIDTDVTLTIALVPDSKVTNVYANYGDAPFYKELQERTGIKLEFQQVADEQALELMLLSGEMPDMIWGTTGMFPGGAQVCVEDGIILPLNDYLDEYMPDFKATLENSKEYEAIVTTAAGNVWGAFHAGETYAQLQIGGLMIRQDWLEDLGLEMPRTADQFYEMLVAFKEQKGAEVPFSTTLANLKNHVLLYGIPGAFGLPRSTWYQIDGEVHYGYAEEEIKDVFAFLHKLYDEKLLDPEFATLDKATEKSNILTGRSGCLYLLTGSTNSYRDSQEDPNYWLSGVTPLVQNEGDRTISGIGNGLAKAGAYVITSNCENPEIAAMLLNYGYTEEGELFYNFGTQGETWEYDDQNQPTFTDMVMNNPDGLSYADAVASMAHGNYSGPFVQLERYYQQALSVDDHRVMAWEKFAETDWEKYSITSSVSIPVEYQDEYSKISSEVGTVISEMIVAYITGAKSLDNFETEYMDVLKSLKIDRMIEIYQIAYDQQVK